MEYQIQITERLQHLETVSAASETEAVETVRKYYKEETVAEIARAYGKKPKDIENRLYRIRKTMRNILIERYGKENVL